MTHLHTLQSAAAYHIQQGDCLDVMRGMDAGSIQTCVTSPPYYGLRDYGHDGQIGLEPTPDAYVAKLVDVFREVRRVLRDDGTVWLNLGDSYAGSTMTGGNNGINSEGGETGYKQQRQFSRKTETPGLKPKDLIGIPWRVAFALQADGWYLRQDIIWHKPNPMPESVTDRCTKAHEYIFLLAKSARYYYDAEAIQEPSVIGAGAVRNITPRNKGQDTSRNDGDRFGVVNNGTRNRRSVWTVTTKPYKGAHFATFPPDLIEPCILAGCPDKCCPKCGKGWERVVERVAVNHKSRQDRQTATGGAISGGVGKNFPDVATTTIAHRPACDCGETRYVPGTVLDPFNGAGTTGVVAVKHGREYIGIEINPEYIEMAEKRIHAATLGQMELIQ